LPWIFSLKGVVLPTASPGGFLQLLQQGIEALEVFLPEGAIPFEPVDGLAERPGIDPARPSLRVAAARDEAGALQHLQVLGDRRPTDRNGSASSVTAFAGGHGPASRAG
jgi:hypothetical protein